MREDIKELQTEIIRLRSAIRILANVAYGHDLSKERYIEILDLIK